MASSRPHPRAVPPILVAALVAVSSAAVLVVTGRFLAAGLLGAVAVGASILAGVWARDSAERRLVFADHAVERLVEAALFGSIAWAWVPEEPWVAAAALCALVASYLASYLTAKATGLGFEVRERLPYRSVRPLLAVVGLLAPRVIGPALWAAAAISLEPVIRHGWSVARQREPA
jgi:CDP-diacylglycerol---glycerol-3-phosphate 3-phosphatidyltransferase